MEMWKDIPEYEGFYQVSNLGRVRSLPRSVPHKRFGSINRRGQVLSERTDKRGYHQARLQRDGRSTYPKVHRLVATLFLENPENLPQVNHKDLDKSNNTIENLEWISEKGNMDHAFAVTVEVENIVTNEVRIVRNISDFCKEVGIHDGNLCKTYSGRRTHTGNWRLNRYVSKSKVQSKK